MSKLISTALDNLAFLGTCLLIIAGIFVIAWAVQHFLLAGNIKRVSQGRRVAYIGMFAAVSGLLMLAEFPLPFLAPPFYEMDLSELPVLICGFFLGPVAGAATELLKILVKLAIKGTSTAFVGDFANFCIGCSMVLPASIVYHVKKSKSTAVIGLAAGALIMTAFGSFLNAVYLLPTFAVMYHMPLEDLVGMGSAINPGITNVTTFALFAVAPFNLIKGVLDGVLAYLLYKRVEQVLFGIGAKKTNTPIPEGE